MLSNEDYFKQPFCQRHRLQEPLKALEERLDGLVSRYKKRYQDIEMQSMLLLVVGLILTSMVCLVINYFVSEYHALGIFVLYLVFLAIILARNNTRMHQLMQSYIIGINTILYLENSNVFHP